MWKVSASSCKKWNIVSKVNIHTFNCKCITFIMNILDMPSGIYDIKISNISVCTVIIGIRCIVHNNLNIFRRFLHRYIKANKLTRLTAYHYKNICIFVRFSMWLFLYEPIQLIKFKKIRRVFNSLI